MTETPDGGSVGSLGRRILASFVVVTLGALALLTAAALVATDRGISVATTGQARQAAQDAAQAAAVAYSRAGGEWEQADLAQVRQIAADAGGRLILRDAAGRPVRASPVGPGSVASQAAAPMATPGAIPVEIGPRPRSWWTATPWAP